MSERNSPVVCVICKKSVNVTAYVIIDRNKCCLYQHTSTRTSKIGVSFNTLSFISFQYFFASCQNFVSTTENGLSVV